MLKSTVSNLLAVIALAAGTCSILSTAVAQQLEPILNPTAESADPDTQEKNIASIYDLTKTARTTNDFTRIVDHCQNKLAENSMDEKACKYLNSLMSWALNRRGEKHLAAAEVLRSVSNSIESQKNMDRAIADFDASFKSDPTRWRALMGRAHAHAMNGEYEQAIQKYTQVNKLNPTNKSAIFNRAEMNYSLKNYDVALDDYRRVVQDNQSDVQAITGGALCYYAQEKYEHAVAEFTSVVRLQPANAAAHCNLGDALQMVGEFSRACDEYTQATQLANAGIACQRLARLLATCPTKEIHQPQAALEMANRAIELDGETPRNLETLACALAAIGNNELAESTKRRAQEMLNQMDDRRAAVRVASDPLR